MSPIAATSSPSVEGAAVATQARHMVIRASAGSGKTYQLVIRYLRTLLDGVPAERILASTFTRKAAGEILGRVLGRLAKASRDPDDLTLLASHLGEPAFDRAACLQLLKTLSTELHRIRIGTLDSFFSQLAKSHTLELGMPPGWDIIDELDDVQLRSQAIASILQEGDVNDIQRLTNLLSKGDAARSVSAKIHETVEDYYGIFQQTDPEAWHRCPELFPLSSETLAATINDLREVELPDLPSYRKRRDADCSNADAEEWDDFLSNGFAAKILQGRRNFGNSKQEISQTACDLYARLIEHGRAIVVRELASRTAATHELLTRFDIAYQGLKQQKRMLRFEDVTQRLAGAFDGDQLDRVAYRINSDIAHLLLDEFQDTSRFQWDVLRPFADQISGAESETSFFCVGDAKQAIYGWRGGVAEIFDAVDQRLPGVETRPLARSRRSSQVVIDTVNRLFSRLTLHENLADDESTVQTWCDAFDRHETARDIPGYVTVETPDESDAPDADKAVDKVLSAAARRVAEIATSAPQAEIGVLVRKNKSIAPLIHLLQNLGIDASEEGGNPLDDSAAVQLLLSLVTLADHPGDTIARFHVANSPLSTSLSLADHADDEAANNLASRIRRQLSDDGYGATFDRWARLLIPVCRRRDLGRLSQLVELAYCYDVQATLRTTRFVEFVASQRIDAPSPAKVRVMSIHQSKGLEFDVVVLPLVESQLIARAPRYVAAGPSPVEEPDRVLLYLKKELRGLLPDELQQTFAISRAAQVRDELCSLYVAVTRAVHALHILIPPCEKSSEKMPSSTAGLVRAALLDDRLPPEPNVLYEGGDPNWTSSAGLNAAAQEDDSRVSPQQVSVQLGEMTDGRSRGMGRVAPSQDAAGTVRLVQLAQGSRSIALERGTLIHAWFEQVTWLDDELHDRDHLTRIAGQLGFAPAVAQRYLTAFNDMLARPEVAELLSKPSYQTPNTVPWGQAVRDELTTDDVTLEVAQERPVAVQLEGELLVGTIDRLVLLRREGKVIAADIIDFKTDAVGEAGAAALDRTEHYRRQLKAYIAAIERIHRLPKERIAARLAFVETGEIVAVT